MSEFIRTVLGKMEKSIRGEGYMPSPKLVFRALKNLGYNANLIKIAEVRERSVSARNFVYNKLIVRGGYKIECEGEIVYIAMDKSKIIGKEKVVKLLKERL